MNTQSCKETYINYIQCKTANLASSLSSKLDIGASDSECLFTKLKLITQYLKILYRYRVPEYEIKYLYAVTINNTDGNSLSLSLSINGLNLGTYSGDDAGQYIVSYFKNYINNNTTSPDYWADTVGSTLYIYSYTTLSYTTYIPYVLDNGTGTAYTGYSTTSYSGNEDYILGVWNCLTSIQIDDIIQHSLILLKNYDACSDLGLAFASMWSQFCTTNYDSVTLTADEIANDILIGNYPIPVSSSRDCFIVNATGRLIFTEIAVTRSGSTGPYPTGIFNINTGNTYYFIYNETYGWNIEDNVNTTSIVNNTGCSGCN